MRRILVIDDNAEITALMNTFLNRSGYQCDTAGSGGEGLALFRRHYYDLILLDAAMPGRTGFEIAAEIRKTSKAPIIIITGHANVVDSAHAMNVGVNQVIYKPFDPDDLRRSIERHLGNPPSGEARIRLVTDLKRKSR